MSKRQSPDTLRQAAASLIHSLDAVQWAADTQGFVCDKWQAEFLRCTDDQVCVATSRQSGKSTTTAILAAHCSVFEPGSLILLISKRQEQATELLRKVKAVLTHPGVNQRLKQDAATSIELVNGSRILSLPSSPESIRGLSSPRLIVEDESAYIDDNVHLALRPMMAASRNGRFILLSTPAAMAGHFWEAFHSPNWRKFKVTAYDIPRISKAFLKRELDEKGDLYFNRECLVQFSNSEFSFFGSDIISAAFDTEEQPLSLRLFT